MLNIKSNKKIGHILSIFTSIVILILVLTVLPIRGENGIYTSVIRLHVLANSNSKEDQEMKLYVRDRILNECASTLITSGADANEAFSLLSSDISYVYTCAGNAVSDYCREKGIEEIPSVNCIVGSEHYPKKYYESLCFPEGEYYSLKVIIGEGDGENWWCVLFPPLCFGAVSTSTECEPNEEEFISVGITGDQYKIISDSENPKYRLRFRFLEIIEEWFS